MPRRSPGQKLINIPMGEEFIRVINEAVVKFNYADRAKLIREAIAEKLKRLGMDVPSHSLAIPTRIGKAGRPAKKSSSARRSPV